MNGSCGSSHNGCAAGAFGTGRFYIADNNTHHRWLCTGLNGGVNSGVCSIIRTVSGFCGSGKNSCTSGSLNVLSNNQTHNRWTCNGLNGGSNSPICSVVRFAHGVCGRKYNSCSSGVPRDYRNNKTHLKWLCNGTLGGRRSPVCSIGRPACPRYVLGTLGNGVHNVSGYTYDHCPEISFFFNLKSEIRDYFYCSRSRPVSYNINRRPEIDRNARITIVACSRNLTPRPRSSWSREYYNWRASQFTPAVINFSHKKITGYMTRYHPRLSPWLCHTRTSTFIKEKRTRYWRDFTYTDGRFCQSLTVPPDYLSRYNYRWTKRINLPNSTTLGIYNNHRDYFWGPIYRRGLQTGRVPQGTTNWLSIFSGRHSGGHIDLTITISGLGGTVITPRPPPPRRPPSSRPPSSPPSGGSVGTGGGRGGRGGGSVGTGGGVITNPSACPNGRCEAGETAFNCAEDCGCTYTSRTVCSHAALYTVSPDCANRLLGVCKYGCRGGACKSAPKTRRGSECIRWLDCSSACPPTSTIAVGSGPACYNGYCSCN